MAQHLDKITSVEISQFALIHPQLLSDLKVNFFFKKFTCVMQLSLLARDVFTQDMDLMLQAEIKKLSEKSSEEERQQSETTSPSSLYQAHHHHSVRHLEQLRQQLEQVLSAAQALDRSLATVREVEADVSTLLANQDPDGQQNEAEREQERHSWRAAVQQRLEAAAEQRDSVDSGLKAAGRTPTMGGATVMCQDVVTSLSRHVVDVENRLVKARKRERKHPESREPGESSMEVCERNAGDDLPQCEAPQQQPQPTSRGGKAGSQLEAKRSRLDGEKGMKTEEEEDVQMSELWRTKWDVQDQRSTQDEDEKESLVQMRVVLSGALREIRGVAEQLGLQEPTLPALQQRYS